MQEEQKVGQRTTLDVLDAQQVLLNARETLVVAQHDRIVASFALLSAMGRLTAEALCLPAVVYDPHRALPRGAGASSSASPRPTDAELPTSAILSRIAAPSFS